MAQLAANSQVPGKSEPGEEPARVKKLHVKVRDHDFELNWRLGDTVVEQHLVERKAVPAVGGPQFPALSQKIAEQWQSNGSHRQTSDPAFDQAVLHVPDTLGYEEMVGVLDAISTPRRNLAAGARQRSVPAFALSLADN